MGPDAWQAWLINPVTDIFMEKMVAEIERRQQMMLAPVCGKRADEVGVEMAYQSGAINALLSMMEAAREAAGAKA